MLGDDEAPLLISTASCDDSRLTPNDQTLPPHKSSGKGFRSHRDLRFNNQNVRPSHSKTEGKRVISDSKFPYWIDVTRWGGVWDLRTCTSVQVGCTNHL
ncbi:hypothetical protein BCR33DRAFT_156448 [Rhizoclosmatium globosum]|uniref:Uncharacterized protein n=1 Tax=Rhizoclosmatium globosum TaxID=329046 RepID=A0A1Y2CG00_9FUNG|nr:hypothetical protein BCR33DRAFT_156448 [Rhizoclosmatium globosum]|eukprot:ORY45959.1 hypothetical protein BCR33DRAFT_156448 [Rhizoclosmatium globosum]